MEPPATRPLPDRSAPGTRDGPVVRSWKPLGLTALAVALAGAAAWPLVMAPGCAAPLAPAAGIALASVLVFGRRMLAGVAIGALLVNIAFFANHPQRELGVLVLPAILAAGAALQAAAAAALVRRFVRWPLLLGEPAEIARFMGACLAASVIAASLGAVALAALRLVAADALGAAWATAWIGELIGLVIVTPIALTVIGRPRSEWKPRRASVGLTLTLVLLFIALGVMQLGRWSEQRLRAGFDRDADSAALMLSAQLRESLRALEALRAVVSIAPQLKRDDLRAMSRPWIDGGGVQAMGWAERTRRDDGDMAMTVRLSEPMGDGSAMLGADALTQAPERDAVLAALKTGQPAATRIVAVAPARGGTDRSLLTIYQPVYSADAGNLVDGRGPLLGTVFARLDPERQLDLLALRLPRHVRLCLIETDAPPVRRIAGEPGCESRTAGLTDQRVLPFADTRWQLKIAADPAAMPVIDEHETWLFSAAGGVFAAVLAAALLATTGRARRIESAVHQRTAALRAQVSERQSAEAALRASEQRFRNILDNVPIGVVYTDLAGGIIQANPRFCELTGYAEAELVALPPLATTHADDVAEEQALTAQLVAGEIAIYRRDKRCVTKSGAVVSVRSTGSLLRDAGDAPWRIVGVVEDVSEHLRLEEAERAREAAEAANQAKSDFLSRMSHELRTPLNAMLGFSQLLEIDQRHPLAPAQRPWVAQIQQAGWHLLEMINDVLDLSRIESGNLRLETAPVDLRELIAATLPLVAGEALRRDVRISQELAPGTSTLLGDGTRVKQILTNLLSNAVKYNRDGGRVHIASRVVAPDVVEVAVTDTGLGMTAAQMSELFKPFNRLGRERGGLEGTGIGLVISRRLAELMGGSIRVKSVSGEGSSFALRLPRAADAETVRSALDAVDAAPAGYHRRRIHYIEDNETNVEVMRGVLAQREQVEMSVSLTGLDGLAAIRSQPPHLILLDMHLPDIDGLDLLRRLKAEPATAAIPVIVVSADATEQHIDDALDAGAIRYLTKPVAVAELLAALDDLLDRMDTDFG